MAYLWVKISDAGSTEDSLPAPPRHITPTRLMCVCVLFLIGTDRINELTNAKTSVSQSLLAETKNRTVPSQAGLLERRELTHVCLSLVESIDRASKLTAE